ncbi:putative membrane protein [Pseudonocardia sp. Ae406_Ps2]|uniref:DoxX family protein n=1 Tax=unclassified Pseudonocardia TaxID=2619320 RepID=UPI00094AFA60|nr:MULTISPECIES: hypothetical protein [unclassified Pseudonocardia]OLL96416.1 putative membrane protein [Pseudonocardia sp. Ae331_Ps2]OLM05872.1 putative membrane protein [Pseudonocardia sp. Ae406_Ps2]OLM27450.1 putative membrane protein [Pseudonocardia sp. Ae706_Ps2]OLM30609.1 putative membrane protein [Pseudonocardia sp. Ae717_Ps2]
MTRTTATRTRQDLARLALGAMLVFAGTSHLTFARREFRAQVPPWVPMDTDDVVLLSGAAEIALGAALAGLPKERRRVGGLAAAFFTAIFPGNLSQYRNRVDGFGLDTDAKRAARLAGQPLLVAWALYAGGLIPRR